MVRILHFLGEALETTGDKTFSQFAASLESRETATLLPKTGKLLSGKVACLAIVS